MCVDIRCMTWILPARWKYDTLERLSIPGYIRTGLGATDVVPGTVVVTVLVYRSGAFLGPPLLSSVSCKQVPIDTAYRVVIKHTAPLPSPRRQLISWSSVDDLELGSWRYFEQGLALTCSSLDFSDISNNLYRVERLRQRING